MSANLPFDANHWCYTRIILRHLCQKCLLGCGQMVPLTTVCQSVVSLCLVWRCECVSSCRARGAAPDGVMISRFIMLLPRSDCGEIWEGPRGSLSSLIALSIFRFTFFSPSARLPTPDHHQVISTASPPCASIPPHHLLHSLCGLPLSPFIVLTLSHSALPSLSCSPSASLYSPTPWSDLPLWGLCVTGECYQSARGRWDDEWACGHSCVSGSFRRCFYFEGCVCHRGCLHVCVSVLMLGLNTEVHIFPLSCGESAAITQSRSFCGVL